VQNQTLVRERVLTALSIAVSAFTYVAFLAI
jgi:hypothetical protein